LFIYNASAQVQPDSLILPFPATSSFQGNSGTCATDLLLNQFRLSKAFIKQEALMNEAIRTAIVRLNNDTIVLPVVFHILSKNPSAITDAVIKAGLADLNDAFAKRGAWSGSKGVDTKIRFCLARVHPDGGNTTGINRVETHWGDHVNPLIEDAKVKATAQWDPQRYINIWLVNSIDLENIAAFECGNWFRLGTAGYATLPPNTGPLDGIVSTGFGLVLAHEWGTTLGYTILSKAFVPTTIAPLMGTGFAIPRLMAATGPPLLAPIHKIAVIQIPYPITAMAILLKTYPTP